MNQKFLVSLFLLSNLFSCGEDTSLSEYPGGTDKHSLNRNWLLGSWMGFEKSVDLSLEETREVQIFFLKNSKFQIKYINNIKEKVEGEYGVNKDQKILLVKTKVSTNNLHLVSPIPQTFKYSYNDKTLKIFNQKILFELKPYDDKELEIPTSSEIMENYRGFEEDFTEETQEVHLGRWNCFVTDHYWKIKIFKDQSFEMEFYNKFDSVMNFSGEILKKKQNSQEKIGIPYKINTNNFVLMLSLNEKNQASAQIFKNQYKPVVYINNIECYK